MAMSAAEIEAVRFKPGSYDASQVGDPLSQVEAEIDAGRSPAALIDKAAFGYAARGYYGYDVDAVDWFLGHILRQHGGAGGADPWCDADAASQLTMAPRPEPAGALRSFRQGLAGDWGNGISAEFKAAWEAFAQEPGIRLRWVPRPGWGAGCDVVTADQETVATVGDLALPSDVAEVRGRKYKLKGVRRASLSDPVVAQIADRSQDDRTGRYAANRKRHWPGEIKVLLDEFAAPVLYVSGQNYGGRGRGRITFPDQRSLWFPVRGTTAGNAIMTAVDESGASVARYRVPGKGLEVVVNPRLALTDEVVLAVAFSAHWLHGYFSTGH